MSSSCKTDSKARKVSNSCHVAFDSKINKEYSIPYNDKAYSPLPTISSNSDER
uniref:Uncharacterized protein n=1 Tax=Heterorhabditis bacteriophora TaxID=37862 RepID=A0A1I7XHB1_HETBA